MNQQDVPSLGNPNFNPFLLCYCLFLPLSCCNILFLLFSEKIIITFLNYYTNKSYQIIKMSSFLELPDELILKVFSYTETVELEPFLMTNHCSKV